MALEATVQVPLACTCLSPETYDICSVHVHMGKPRGSGPCHFGTLLAVPILTSHSVTAFLYQRSDALLSEDAVHLFNDTLFCPEVPSARGCMIVEIFATNSGWSQSFPMLWKWKPLRLLLSYLHGKVSHQWQLSIVQRRWSWESLPRSARRHHAACGIPSPILHDLTPISMRLENSRRVLPGSWLSQVCSSGFLLE